MKTPVFSLLAGLVSIATAASVLADTAAPTTVTPTVQVAVVNPVTPVMSHEVATLIKLTQSAEAQYRRSGSTQDLARVRAMRTELASRGFGRITITAPIVMAKDTALVSTDDASIATVTQ